MQKNYYEHYLRQEFVPKTGFEKKFNNEQLNILHYSKNGNKFDAEVLIAAYKIRGLLLSNFVEMFKSENSNQQQQLTPPNSKSNNLLLIIFCWFFQIESTHIHNYVKSLFFSISGPQIINVETKTYPSTPFNSLGSALGYCGKSISK